MGMSQIQQVRGGMGKLRPDDISEIARCRERIFENSRTEGKGKGWREGDDDERWISSVSES